MSRMVYRGLSVLTLTCTYGLLKPIYFQLSPQRGLVCAASMLSALFHADKHIRRGHLLQIGALISQALERVGRQGVVTQEESRTAEDHLYVVEGMQFDRGYISPYFVTDPERMVGQSASTQLDYLFKWTYLLLAY